MYYVDQKVYHALFGRKTFFSGLTTMSQAKIAESQKRKVGGNMLLGDVSGRGTTRARAVRSQRVTRVPPAPLHHSRALAGLPARRPVCYRRRQRRARPPPRIFWR